MTAPAKQTVQRSFTATMDDMRQELTPAEAFVSRLIHAPVIAAIGSLLAGTLLRPRALILGGWTAAIVFVGIQLVALSYGYSPSGSESLLAFGLGWIVSTLYDSAAALFRRSRSRHG